jgi:secreted PhoX family phosphatase
MRGQARRAPAMQDMTGARFAPHHASSFIRTQHAGQALHTTPSALASNQIC